MKLYCSTIGGVLKPTTYEQSIDPEYDVKLTFTLPSTGELMGVL